MNRMILLALTAMSMTASMSYAAPVQSAADKKLEERVRKEFGNLPAQAKPMELADGLRALQGFNTAASTNIQKCVDAKRTVFAKKYVMSYDEQGAPCRIYDLSFPTAESLVKLVAMQMPLQPVDAQDYNDWLDGNFAAIKARQDAFKKNFNPQVVAKTSWLAQLKFRRQPVLVNGLPQSFKASDLDLGGSFKFDAGTKAQVQQLIRQSQVYSMTVGGNEPLISDYWMQVLNKPEMFLDGVKFQWNDLEKVYDVVLDGEFLPIMGPVTLVDYRVQYKYAVEKMVRSILSSGLQKAAMFIPEPFTARAISVLVGDAFEQLEMAYQYQMNQLEATLGASIRNPAGLEIAPADMNKGLNILYGTRSSLLSAYIMSVAKGTPFDWSAIDRIGAQARYNDEKGKMISRANMNSKMVLEQGCQATLVYDYFGQCTLNGHMDGIYSLISERIVWGYSFGAPLIYRFDYPYEVALKRGGTWALSIGLRIAPLPIPGFILSQLDQILKNYMMTGITDEAYLRNSMYMANLTGPMMDWLYIQNLNPFLPKTATFEQKIIEANMGSF